MLTLPPELREAMKDSGNQPVRLVDPDSQFLLMPVDLASVLDGERLSFSEQIHLLRAAGLRAGWDDPEMDLYHDLDPRRK